jgi:hypothetical protein
VSKEINIMDQKDTIETSNQQPQIEDLAVNEGQAAGIKGGPFVDGSVRFVKDSVTQQTW